MAAEGGKRLLFHEMGLDQRLLKAISKLEWPEPTLVQERVIPLALAGKDIIARARTGSGKTAAFAIPIIQHILQNKELYKVQQIRALVMAPTKELCRQIQSHFMFLTKYCSREVRCVDISQEIELQAQKAVLVDVPDVIIGTPSKVRANLISKNICLKSGLQMFAIDEADLTFSFGYKNDTTAIKQFLPDVFQSFLMSATLTDDVFSLSDLYLRNPVMLKLEEPFLPSTKQLTQYVINCEEEEKFVMIYALLKLNLIRGKTIIFMNSVDRCYQMKLYLEQFAIPACIVNCELPVASRCHIVSQFNEGLYDIIIASDDKSLTETKSENEERAKDLKEKKRKLDKEYSVSRGIDFQFVSNVINFDFPPDINSYIHRVGRIARGKNEGSALSFVSAKEVPIMDAVEKFLTTKEKGEKGKTLFKPFRFQTDKIEGFRYRARDAYRAVTRIAVREARLKEIKKEILNSQKLKAYFENNPRDLQILRHDRTLHTVKIQSHLKHVPDYIVPDALKNVTSVKKAAKNNHKNEKPKAKPKLTKAELRFKKRKADPLQSFTFKGFKKRKTE